MKRPTKIIIIAAIVVVGMVILLFPGFFPIRVFEPIFAKTCTGLLGGQFETERNTDFVGLGGAPVRTDYAQCGVTRAIDANHICYVAPSNRPSFLAGDNPLGQETTDECDDCQFGSLDIKDGKILLGRSCRPYKFLWRWNYKTNF